MKKILIVEDDPMLIEIYKKKFSVDGNFEVLNATNGKEARKITAKEKLDLILLDLVLPEEDGFEILEKLHQNSLTSKIKVVVFSNLSQEEDKQKARELGAIDFWIKSEHTPQQAVDKVKELLK